MRTKVLICAAALAASLASSMAQNVYSLNVVGYVNITIPPSQSAVICNPLDATMGGTITGGNDITNLFTPNTGNPQSGSSIYQFNGPGGNYLPASTYSAGLKRFSPNFTMNPGYGVLYFNNSSITPTVITFVGQVEQGTYNVATVPASTSAILGSPVPIGGSISNSTTVLGMVPHTGDAIYTFNAAGGSWNSASTYSTGLKKFTPDTTINPGQGFLYFNNNAAAAQVWVSNFTVQ